MRLQLWLLCIMWSAGLPVNRAAHCSTVYLGSYACTVVSMVLAGSSMLAGVCRAQINS